jgi:hypothetical protein
LLAVFPKFRFASDKMIYYCSSRLVVDHGNRETVLHRKLGALLHLASNKVCNGSNQ